MRIFNKKRGASPLIATIVLIAFAVSLGGFIMSLGSFYFDKFNNETGCMEYEIQAFKLDNSPQCSKALPSKILNFYDINDMVNPPTCYVNILRGSGNVCSNEIKLLNRTWIENSNSIN